MIEEVWNSFLKLGGPAISPTAPGASKRAIEAFSLKDGVILNLGCGQHGYTQEFRDKGFAVVEADYNPSDDTIIPIDMHDLSRFYDFHFEGVFTGNVLEHAMAPFIVFTEINKVLETGGRWLCVIPANHADWIKDENHFFVPSKEQLEEFLKRSGFELVWFEYTPDGKMNYFEAVKVKNYEL